MPACLSGRQMPSPGRWWWSGKATGALEPDTQADSLLSNGLVPWNSAAVGSDFPGNGTQTPAHGEEGASPPCLQLLASVSLSRFFFAILGLSILHLLGALTPTPLCLYLFFFLLSCFLTSSPICLFLSLWSPLGLCSQESTDGAPPSSQGSPHSLESPSRVFLL